MRLDGSEKDKLEDAREEMYGEEVAENIPLGQVVGELADRVLSGGGADGG